MSPDRRADQELVARLASFAALAALAAWAWTRLVADPPAGRVALAVLALSAGAAMVALIGAANLRRARSWSLAALAALGAATVGLVAVGVPAGELLPEGWDRLADQLERGFAGLDGTVDYPFEGKNESSRLVLLAGLPLALGLAAALTFWPAGRERGRRALGLAVLIATFAIGATVVAPGEPLLLGVLLLIGVAAWLWLPRLARRDAFPALALVAVAGTVALAAAAALDAEDPWIDYSDWELAAGGGADFDWNHHYGPLDWPRDGTTVLRVRSDEPRYWRASVLDEFDGTRWLQPGDAAGRRLEVPSQVEGGGATVDLDALNPEWLETVEVGVGPMRTDLVIAPGTPIEVTGFEGVDPRPDGSVALYEEIDDGDEYSALAYTPDPSPEQLRSAPERYPPLLAPYTEIGLPAPTAGSESAPAPLDDVDIPLRGGFGVSDEVRAERRRILASPYASMFRLAHRLTAGQPNTHRAVLAVESYLRSARFGYSEAVPGGGRYPLADFLDRDRRGYCQQFSGAMALMLRMVGIPSRVASGFSAGVEDPDARNEFLVSDLDAHSWVEVYFTGIGWVPYEPTPSAAPAASQIGEGDLAAGPEALGRQQSPAPALRGGDEAVESGTAREGSGLGWAIALGAIGIIVLCAGIAVAVRARRFRSLSPAAAVDAQLRELGRGLDRFGLAIDPGETLLALERRLRARLRPATADYAATLRRGRFQPGGPAPPAPAERRAVRRELRSRGASGGRMRAMLAFPLGGPRS